MSENINGSDLLGSGGHVWVWSEPDVTRKSVGSAAIRGEYHQVTSVGVRPGRIAGRDGRPALLKATAATKALADAALNVLEAAIEDLVTGGDQVEWEDDQDHSGIALVLTGFRRAGPRVYGKSGSDTAVWQRYALEFIELDGGF